MPKLHKAKFGTRSLINCSETIFDVISKTLDFYMKTIAVKHFSYLIDSQYLIQLTQNQTFSSNSKLFTADVVALYSNISIEKSIEIMSNMMSKINFDHFTAFGFHSLLKLTLKNNFLLSKLKKTLSFLNTYLYYRYLDDLFIVSENLLEKSDF